MSLAQALTTAASGLRTTQAGLALIASNVANAETPGYVRKTLVQSTAGTDVIGASVRVDGVNRELDQYVQRQLWSESAGGGYATERARFYDRLQLLFGQPGVDSALETRFNAFTAALQELGTTPESYSVRSNVLSTAQVLTQQLNSMTQDVQGLRAYAENGISDAVNSANEAMRQIADINHQLAANPDSGAATASLRDQRDHYIDQLAKLMDIRVVDVDARQVSVFTNSGVQLVGTKASQLTFDPQGTMTAGATWSADPTKRSVGTIAVFAPNGDGVDLLAANSIRSGEIAAFVEMRDKVLVEAQAQLDALAAAMAQALSDKITGGMPVTAGAQSGFDLDLAGLLNGNSGKLSYTDVASGAQRTVTFVRVDGAGVLPLTGAAAGTATDRVVGVSFAGGTAAVAAAIDSALGAGFTASNPAGTTLRVLDDGGVNVALRAATTTRTVTSLASGTPELPFFVDGPVPYTGAFTAVGSQLVGLAGRLEINTALVGDPSKLVVFSTSPATAPGDNTRPNFIRQQLTELGVRFPPSTGLGAAASPYQAAIPDYLRQVLGQQAQNAAAAESLRQGQQVVVNALQQRFSDTAGVNIDEEMANLLKLQSAYGANARVLTAVKEMLDTLMRT
jgi:flagellar hook-associated protein 1 FlgK